MRSPWIQGERGRDGASAADGVDDVPKPLLESVDRILANDRHVLADYTRGEQAGLLSSERLALGRGTPSPAGRSSLRLGEARSCRAAAITCQCR